MSKCKANTKAASKSKQNKTGEEDREQTLAESAPFTENSHTISGVRGDIVLDFSNHNGDGTETQSASEADGLINTWEPSRPSWARLSLRALLWATVGMTVGTVLLLACVVVVQPYRPFTPVGPRTIDHAGYMNITKVSDCGAADAVAVASCSNGHINPLLFEIAESPLYPEVGQCVVSVLIRMDKGLSDLQSLCSHYPGILMSNSWAPDECTLATDKDLVSEVLQADPRACVATRTTHMTKCTTDASPPACDTSGDGIPEWLATASDCVWSEERAALLLGDISLAEAKEWDCGERRLE